MAYIPKAERDALPASDFGDPQRRLFPIRNQQDVDDAARLIGRARDPEAVKERILAICKRKRLTPPAAWVKEKAGMSTSFSQDNATVVRRGKISEAGSYPDKGIELTPEDFALAAEQFAPVPIEVEHMPSVFDGKLGQLRRVWLADDGWSLEGEVEIPTWLDRILAAGERKVSAVWNRDEKQIAGLGLVRDPRIPDAVFEAAFSAFAKRHDTHAGQAALQDLHNLASRYGATCRQGNVGMASAHENNAIQQIHDLATEHGAVCDQIKTIQGANSPALAFSADAPATREVKRMSARGFFAGLLGGARDAGVIGEADSAFDAAVPDVRAPVAAMSASVDAAQSAEIERLRIELARAKAERLQVEAAAFADREIAEHRAYPAERESIIALFAQAVADDDTHGLVSFANGSQGGRLDLVRSLFAMRPPHELTQERVRTETAATVFSAQPTTSRAGEAAELKEDERERLLALTATGRQLLAERRGNRS